MKNLIAIICVIIMIIIDNDIRFKNLFNFKKSEPTKSIETFVSHKPSNVWIYNPEELSDRNWINFGSRRSRQELSPLLELCNSSIKLYLKDRFKVIIFSDKDLIDIIPEYVGYKYRIKNKYLYHNLIKYTILYKYGGFWLKNDTIMLNNLENKNFDLSHINFYKLDDNNSSLYSDDIMLVEKKHPVIKTVLDYIFQRINTFQNTDFFKNSILVYLNKQLDSKVKFYFYNITLQKDLSNNLIDYNLYLKSFHNNILENKHYTFFSFNLDKVCSSYDYDFIYNLSQEQLLDSPMFISTILNYAFDYKKSLIHIGILEKY